MNVRPVAASRSHMRWGWPRRRKVTAHQCFAFRWRLALRGAVPLALILAGGSGPNAQAGDALPPVVAARSPSASATGVSTTCRCASRSTRRSIPPRSV